MQSILFSWSLRKLGSLNFESEQYLTIFKACSFDAEAITLPKVSCDAVELCDTVAQKLIVSVNGERLNKTKHVVQCQAQRNCTIECIDSCKAWERGQFR